MDPDFVNRGSGERGSGDLFFFQFFFPFFAMIMVHK